MAYIGRAPTSGFFEKQDIFLESFIKKISFKKNNNKEKLIINTY